MEITIKPDTSGFKPLPESKKIVPRLVPILSLLGFTEKRKAEGGDLTNIREEYQAYRQSFINNFPYEHSDRCRCKDCTHNDMTYGDYNHITNEFI